LSIPGNIFKNSESSYLARYNEDLNDGGGFLINSDAAGTGTCVVFSGSPVPGMDEGGGAPPGGGGGGGGAFPGGGGGGGGGGDDGEEGGGVGLPVLDGGGFSGVGMDGGGPSLGLGTLVSSFIFVSLKSLKIIPFNFNCSFLKSSKRIMTNGFLIYSIQDGLVFIITYFLKNNLRTFFKLLL
jgi:hypothetical protein